MEEVEVKPTWGLAWGLWWRTFLIILGINAAIALILLIIVLLAPALIPFPEWLLGIIV